MNTIEQVVLASILLVLGGCAAPVAGNQADVRDQALQPTTVVDTVTADVDGQSLGSETQEASLAAPETVALSLDLVDSASGDAIADAEVCRFGFEAPLGYALGGSHAPAVTFVDDGLRCQAQSDDGISVSQNVETLLAAHAPGYPMYTVHVTSHGDDARIELTLLTDAQLDDAYGALGETRDASASSVVVETPADDVRVTLSPIDAPLDSIAPSAYLDVKGARTDTAVAGGKALFSNVAMGPYEARVEHDLLRCDPYGVGNWRGLDGVAVWAVGPFDAYVGGVLCHR